MSFLASICRAVVANVVNEIFTTSGDPEVEKIRREMEEQFNKIQHNFNNHEEKIRHLAQLFRGLIQKIRNMCSSEARIQRDITSMREQLIEHLNILTNLNGKIQDTAVQIVGNLSKMERQANQAEQEKQAHENNQRALKLNMEEAERQLNNVRYEQERDRQRLQQLYDERREMEEVQGVLMWIPIVGWIAAGVIEICKSIDDLEGKISRAQSAVNNWNSKIENLGGEISEYQSKINEKSRTIRSCKRMIESINRMNEKLQKNQQDINHWTRCIQAWLNFLTEMEPQVERVERHIGYNENALHRAINDLKIAVNGADIKSLEMQAKKLAITDGV